jgi:hypothetical protein
MHILRAEQLTKAAERYGEEQLLAIPTRNEKKLRSLGIEQLKKIMPYTDMT